MNYLYLHGFASGPQSTKAVYFRDRCLAKGITLDVPDLNQNDFFNLTLTRQIDQCQGILDGRSDAWTIIGSSFGGLTAAWLGQRNPRVERLVLLAPAFEFLPHWHQQLGNTQLEQWQQNGVIEVYHYGCGQTLPLSYRFWMDARQYEESSLDRAIPTLILHGTEDDVIPLQASRRYQTTRPWCTLLEFPSDHALVDVLPDLWTATQSFCGLTYNPSTPVTPNPDRSPQQPQCRY